MELLQLIFFTFSYNYMSTGLFLNTLFFYLLLKLTYKKNNITIQNNLDPTVIIVNLLNIILHILFNQIILLINKIKNNNNFNKIISSYNIINNKYVILRNKTLYYIIFTPLKFVMKKLIKNIDLNTNIELKSNQDINMFLDGLLDKNH